MRLGKSSTGWMFYKNQVSKMSTDNFAFTSLERFAMYYDMCVAANGRSDAMRNAQQALLMAGEKPNDDDAEKYLYFSRRYKLTKF